MNYPKFALIGTAVDIATATAPANVASGRIAMFSVQPDGTYTLMTSASDVTTAKAAGYDFVLVQGVPVGKSLKTAPIKNGAARFKSAEVPYSAPIPQVWVVGYDGTSYDLENGAAGTFGLSIANMSLGAPPFPTNAPSSYFAIASNATSLAEAEQLSKLANSETLLSSYDRQFVFTEVLSSATSVQLVTSAPANITGTFVNGSPNVTLSGSSVGGTTVIAAGDYIRTGSATVKTCPVYKVLSVNTTSVILDRPYVNPSLTIGATVSGVALGYIAQAGGILVASAGVRATEFGNLFNGSQVLEPMPNKNMSVATTENLYGTPVQNNKQVTKAYTAASGAGTTGVASQGAGTYAQVFKYELDAAGYEGFINRIWLPDNFPLYSVSTSTYDTFSIVINQPQTDFSAQTWSRNDTTEIFIALEAGNYTTWAAMIAAL